MKILENAPRPRTLALAGLPLLLAGLPHAQEARRAVPPPPAPSTQVVLPDGRAVASDPPGLVAPPEDAPGPLAPGLDGGPVSIVDVALPDQPPRPDAPVVAPGADGDRLVSPASGDPFFLAFSAGRHYPPAGEQLDAVLVSQVQLAPLDGRPEPVVYGYVMLARRITPERVAAIEALGCRVLGTRPHNNLIAAFAPQALDAVAAHPDVRWVGAARAWQKVHPGLTRVLEENDAGRALDLWVSVYESDVGAATVRTPFGVVEALGPGPAVASPENPDPRPVRVRTNGWQERALEALGLEVLDFDERNPAFRVRALPALVPLLTELDFVQALGLVSRPQPAHDESMPMVHADYGRYHANGGTNQVAIVGEADSGIDISHWDLDHFWGAGWDLTGGGQPWSGTCDHGTYVAGTILGNGDVEAGHTGAAPGLGWGGTGRFFNLRILDDLCGGGYAPMSQIVSVYGNPALSTPRPHVTNNSWGCPPGPCGGPFDGTEQDAVTLDNGVYQNDQLWVFAAGNSGPGAMTMSLESTAKNVFTVGAVSDYKWILTDPGAIWSGSSRGPTLDGRWKPNVCAPGVEITSTLAGTTTGYVDSGGTSAAAPHVTGVAAQLVDAYAFLRYAPARLASLLMATAITRYDQTLSTPSESHLDAYGTGRLDAMRAMHSSSQMGWTNWGFALNAGQATYSDFTVSPGATRLIVCMHYVEPGAAVNSGKALVNDFDLWLDREPIDPGLNTGEYFAQQSTLDNTEIRIIDSPPVGQWRWKIWPDATTTSAKFGLTVSVLYGDTTPDGSLVVDASKAFVQPNQAVEVTASAYNPHTIASAVYLDGAASSGAQLLDATTTLLDGKPTSLLSNYMNGWDVLLGNIRHGTSRSAKWTVRWPTEGWKVWNVDARSENWVDKFASVTVGVDGTPPAKPWGFSSSSHQTGSWSKNPDVTIGWKEPSDNLSGVAGYAWGHSFGVPSSPPPVLMLTGTSVTTSLITTVSGQYLNVRAVDGAGNWGLSAAMGPFLIDTQAPSGAGALGSSSHTPGVVSCSTAVTMTWTPASDAHSGLAGYAAVWDTSSSTVPGGSVNVSSSHTSLTSVLSSSTQGQWFHLRSRDVAGNWGPTVHSGPYFVNAQQVSTYCTAKVNSQGCAPTVVGLGSPSVSGGAFRVNVSQVVNNKLGILIWSKSQAAIAFQGGFLCVAPPVFRTPIQGTGGNPPPDDCSGTMSFQWTTVYLQSQGLFAGETVHSQYWSRDPAASFGSSLSNALSFTLCP